MYAFEVTEDDISTVLRANIAFINFDGRSIDDMASDLIDELDAQRIEHAALSSGTEMDDQTCGAHDEIKSMLCEMGVLIGCTDRTPFYVWANEHCDNTSEDLTEAKRWADEFQSDGYPSVYVLNADQHMIYSPSQKPTAPL